LHALEPSGVAVHVLPSVVAGLGFGSRDLFDAADRFGTFEEGVVIVWRRRWQWDGEQGGRGRGGGGSRFRSNGGPGREAGSPTVPAAKAAPSNQKTPTKKGAS
jgi:hypothetical protein